jgi:hypothetical protein
VRGTTGCELRGGIRSLQSTQVNARRLGNRRAEARGSKPTHGKTQEERKPRALAATSVFRGTCVLDLLDCRLSAQGYISSYRYLVSNSKGRSRRAGTTVNFTRERRTWTMASNHGVLLDNESIPRRIVSYDEWHLRTKESRRFMPFQWPTLLHQSHNIHPPPKAHSNGFARAKTHRRAHYGIQRRKVILMDLWLAGLGVSFTCRWLYVLHETHQWTNRYPT